jgi:bifunctional DNA-binding transcriptional regulator/antitoxin component of YhaV-PrlF toxin-antitoxin module
MSITLTVTAKGQVTLRKEVLEHLGARQGDRLQLDLMPGGRVQVRARAGKPIGSIFGLGADPDGPKLTLEQIQALASEGWAGQG